MRWPTGMEPERTPVYARNETVIPASPERVWRWLIRAERWPQWYSNCAWIRFESGSGPDLTPDRRFVWKTFGATVHSTVRVFEPMSELGWDAYGWLEAYHGWMLEAVGDQTRVITEETQRGLLPTIARWYLRPMLLRGHQEWVESLSRVAGIGDPG